MKSFLEGRAAVAKEGGATIRQASAVNHALPTFARGTKEPESAIEHRDTPLPVQSVRHGPVKIETLEEQGIVRSIVVTCSCGERIEVHCGY